MEGYGEGPDDHLLWGELGEDRFLARLRAYAERRVPAGEGVEDVVNTAVLETLIAVRCRTISHPLAYAKKCVRTICSKLRKKKKKLRAEILIEHMDSLPGPIAREVDGAPIRGEVLQLRRTIEPNLSNEQRETFDVILTGVATPTELSRCLGLRKGTAKARIRRLRKTVLACAESLPNAYPRGP